MFELSVAGKYLIPKRKQLSVSLIALMSVGVITLVVWLLLIFLSVTEGIEKSWLEKLTSLNAPLRINPTPAYFSSYYYQVDSISEASQFSHKTLGEKAAASHSDPYNPASDMEVPRNWPQAERLSDGSLRDPVKEVFNILAGLQKKLPDLAFQDYELSGAMMRLNLLRPESVGISRGDESQTIITQASYLASFADRSLYLSKLFNPPSVQDLNQLSYFINRKVHNSCQDNPLFASLSVAENFSKNLHSLLDNVKIKELKTSANRWKIPLSFVPEGLDFRAEAFMKNGKISHIIIPQSGTASLGTLRRDGNNLSYKSPEGKVIAIGASTPLIVDKGMRFQADIVPSSLEKASQLKEVLFAVKSSLQGHVVQGELGWDGMEIADAVAKTEFEKTPAYPPLWAYSVKEPQGKGLIVLPQGEDEASGVLIPKSFQEAGVRIGDRGYLAYSAPTTSAIQEQRVPIYITGFYDPGIMSVGNKCILVPHSLARTVNATSNSFVFDQTTSNGIQIWFKDLKMTDQVKQELCTAFEKAGVGKYWKVTTYKEYDFAKDLLQQFQSDKYLFTLVGVIILIVACCNIISLLVLLVNDKKREIGILQAMGASRRSIAAIFGLCGMGMGILGSLLGIGAALLTLHNIDGVVALLSWVQGHDAFNTLFYGKSLPSQLSSGALTFILVTTPLISLCAGLVPAIKACLLRPSAILRSE